MQVAHAPGMPGTFSPAADFKENRLLTISACITARAWRTCRDACRDRLHAVTGKTFPAFPAHAHPQFYVSGKRPMIMSNGATNMDMEPDFASLYWSLIVVELSISSIIISMIHHFLAIAPDSALKNMHEWIEYDLNHNAYKIMGFRSCAYLRVIMYKVKSMPQLSAIFWRAPGKIMCNGANSIVMEPVFQLKTDYTAWRLWFAGNCRGSRPIFR